MLKHRITIKNALSYLEGNAQLILEDLDLQADHIKEQIAYRRFICKDTCGKKGECEYCGCEFYGKTSVHQSCNNGEKFPDLMSKIEWDKFKIKNKL